MPKIHNVKRVKKLSNEVTDLVT